MKKLKNDLLAVYSASLRAVLMENLMSKFVSFSSDHHRFMLKVSQGIDSSSSYSYDVTNRPIYIFGAGKSVIGMCRGFLNAAKSANQKFHNQVTVSRGILSVPRESNISNRNIFNENNIDLLPGAKNNLPDADAIKNTEEIISLIKEAKSKAYNGPSPLLVGFISGGGSALLCKPEAPLNLSDKLSIIKNLIAQGAPITQLNAKRKTISAVKGGKLAKLIASEPGPLEAVIFIASDIIGDPLDMIASGPTITEHNLESIKNVLVVNNELAITAASREAKSLGYKVISLGGSLSGEASNLGMALAKKVMEHPQHGDNLMWIGGGETTVTLGKKHGTGGRCQELALSFVHHLNNLHLGATSSVPVMLAAGTDGQDGPTPVAGAISIPLPIPNVIREQLQEALNYHDAFTFWTKNYPENLVDTGGPTGTNVMDIILIARTFIDKRRRSTL